MSSSFDNTTRLVPIIGPGVQIVPEHFLESRLGKGGFGEVWKAIGPGKVPVALKIIEIKDSQTGEREFRSLDLLRELRHPNLLPMQGYWLLDEIGQVIKDDRPPTQLVIAMLLGGKNLRQRLDECKLAGMSGIPPAELLEYMRDAARGIDFLNRPVHVLGDRVVAIQHRDIKPHNLMIVGGGVMVADFGIAGVMESSHVHTEQAAMTFAYAAPELFEHTASAWTDQYALAISYCELRTGKLPFAGNSTTMQIVMAHTHGGHDFTSLPPNEADVLRRATTRVPEQRFTTCQEFVAHLETALRASGLLTRQSIDSGISGLPTAACTPTSFYSGSSAVPPLTDGTPPTSPEVALDIRSTHSNVASQTLPFAAPRLSKPKLLFRRVIIGGLLLVSAAGGAAWWFREYRPVAREPLVSPSVPPMESPPSIPSTTPVKEPTREELLLAARQKAAEADRTQRHREVIAAIQPVFDAADAKSEDYTLRGRAFLALGDAQDSPAENYDRAAQDFAQAGAPRDQLKALARLGRWYSECDIPKAIQPLRQALQLQEVPVLQLLLAQSLLATGDAKSAHSEAVGALKAPSDTNGSNAETTARLHYVAGRAARVLAEQAATDSQEAAAVEDFDQQSEQHLQQAIALAKPIQLSELNAWQTALAELQKLPRMVAREELRLARKQIVDLTKELDQTPDDAAQWLKLAELEKQVGETQLATAHFAQGHGLQAIQLARDGKLTEASEVVAQAKQHDSEATIVYYARAVIAVGLGLDRDALPLFDAAIASSPATATQRWRYLADRAATHARIASDDLGTAEGWDRAREDFDAALAAFPDAASLMQPQKVTSKSPSVNQRALADLQWQRATVLIALAEVARRKDPELWSQADDALKAATSLDPSEPRYSLAAGKLALQQLRAATPKISDGLLNAAAERCATTLRLAPQFAEAHSQWGECLLLRGDVAAAQAAFDKAVECGEKESEKLRFQFNLNRAYAYLRSPRNDSKALQAAEMAIELQPDHPDGHFVHGVALRNLSQTPQALLAFEQALSRQAKHVGALLAKSQLMIESENSTSAQREQANRDIETALATATTDELRAESHYVRSLSSMKSHLLRAGERSIAEPALLQTQRDLLQAVKLTPTNGVYAQAAKELFDYAARYVWSDATRKSESNALQQEWAKAR